MATTETESVEGARERELHAKIVEFAENISRKPSKEEKACYKNTGRSQYETRTNAVLEGWAFLVKQLECETPGNFSVLFDIIYLATVKFILDSHWYNALTENNYKNGDKLKEGLTKALIKIRELVPDKFVTEKKCCAVLEPLVDVDPWFGVDYMTDILQAKEAEKVTSSVKKLFQRENVKLVDHRLELFCTAKIWNYAVKLAEACYLNPCDEDENLDPVENSARVQFKTNITTFFYLLLCCSRSKCDVAEVKMKEYFSIPRALEVVRELSDSGGSYKIAPKWKEWKKASKTITNAAAELILEKKENASDVEMVKKVFYYWIKNSVSPEDMEKKDTCPVRDILDVFNNDNISTDLVYALADVLYDDFSYLPKAAETAIALFLQAILNDINHIAKVEVVEAEADEDEEKAQERIEAEQLKQKLSRKLSERYLRLATIFSHDAKQSWELTLTAFSLSPTAHLLEKLFDSDDFKRNSAEPKFEVSDAMQTDLITLAIRPRRTNLCGEKDLAKLKDLCKDHLETGGPRIKRKKDLVHLEGNLDDYQPDPKAVEDELLDTGYERGFEPNYIKRLLKRTKKVVPRRVKPTLPAQKRSRGRPRSVLTPKNRNVQPSKSYNPQKSQTVTFSKQKKQFKENVPKRAFARPTLPSRVPKSRDFKVSTLNRRSVKLGSLLKSLPRPLPLIRPDDGENVDDDCKIHRVTVNQVILLYEAGEIDIKSLNSPSFNEGFVEFDLNFNLEATNESEDVDFLEQKLLSEFPPKISFPVSTPVVQLSPLPKELVDHHAANYGLDLVIDAVSEGVRSVATAYSDPGASETLRNALQSSSCELPRELIPQVISEVYPSLDHSRNRPVGFRYIPRPKFISKPGPKSVTQRKVKDFILKTTDNLKQNACLKRAALGLQFVSGELVKAFHFIPSLGDDHKGTNEQTSGLPIASQKNLALVMCFEDLIIYRARSLGTGIPFVPLPQALQTSPGESELHNALTDIVTDSRRSEAILPVILRELVDLTYSKPERIPQPLDPGEAGRSSPQSPALSAGSEALSLSAAITSDCEIATPAAPNDEQEQEAKPKKRPRSKTARSSGSAAKRLKEEEEKKQKTKNGETLSSVPEIPPPPFIEGKPQPEPDLIALDNHSSYVTGHMFLNEGTGLFEEAGSGIDLVLESSDPGQCDDWSPAEEDQLEQIPDYQLMPGGRKFNFHCLDPSENTSLESAITVELTTLVNTEVPEVQLSRDGRRKISVENPSNRESSTSPNSGAASSNRKDINATSPAVSDTSPEILKKECERRKVAICLRRIPDDKIKKIKEKLRGAPYTPSHDTQSSAQNSVTGCDLSVSETESSSSQQSGRSRVLRNDLSDSTDPGRRSSSGRKRKPPKRTPEDYAAAATTSLRSHRSSSKQKRKVASSDDEEFAPSLSPRKPKSKSVLSPRKPTRARGRQRRRARADSDSDDTESSIETVTLDDSESDVRSPAGPLTPCPDSVPSPLTNPANEVLAWKALPIAQADTQDEDADEEEDPLRSPVDPLETPENDDIGNVSEAFVCIESQVMDGQEYISIDITNSGSISEKEIEQSEPELENAGGASLRHEEEDPTSSDSFCIGEPQSMESVQADPLFTVDEETTKSSAGSVVSGGDDECPKMDAQSLLGTSSQPEEKGGVFLNNRVDNNIGDLLEANDTNAAVNSATLNRPTHTHINDLKITDDDAAILADQIIEYSRESQVETDATGKCSNVTQVPCVISGGGDCDPLNSNASVWGSASSCNIVGEATISTTNELSSGDPTAAASGRHELNVTSGDQDEKAEVAEVFQQQDSASENYEDNFREGAVLEVIPVVKADAPSECAVEGPRDKSSSLLLPSDSRSTNSVPAVHAISAFEADTMDQLSPDQHWMGSVSERERLNLCDEPDGVGATRSITPDQELPLTEANVTCDQSASIISSPIISESFEEGKTAESVRTFWEETDPLPEEEQPCSIRVEEDRESSDIFEDALATTMEYYAKRSTEKSAARAGEASADISCSAEDPAIADSCSNHSFPSVGTESRSPAFTESLEAMTTEDSADDSEATIVEEAQKVQLSPTELAQLHVPAQKVDSIRIEPAQLPEAEEATCEREDPRAAPDTFFDAMDGSEQGEKLQSVESKLSEEPSYAICRSLPAPVPTIPLVREDTCAVDSLDDEDRIASQGGPPVYTEVAVTSDTSSSFVSDSDDASKEQPVEALSSEVVDGRRRRKGKPKRSVGGGVYYLPRPLPGEGSAGKKVHHLSLSKEDHLRKDGYMQKESQPESQRYEEIIDLTADDDAEVTKPVYSISGAYLNAEDDKTTGGEILTVETTASAAHASLHCADGVEELYPDSSGGSADDLQTHLIFDESEVANIVQELSPSEQPESQLQVAAAGTESVTPPLAPSVTETDTEKAVVTSSTDSLDLHRPIRTSFESFKDQVQITTSKMAEEATGASLSTPPAVNLESCSVNDAEVQNIMQPEVSEHEDLERPATTAETVTQLSPDITCLAAGKLKLRKPSSSLVARSNGMQARLRTKITPNKLYDEFLTEPLITPRGKRAEPGGMEQLVVGTAKPGRRSKVTKGNEEALPPVATAPTAVETEDSKVPKGRTGKQKATGGRPGRKKNAGTGRKRGTSQNAEGEEDVTIPETEQAISCQPKNSGEVSELLSHTFGEERCKPSQTPKSVPCIITRESTEVALEMPEDTSARTSVGKGVDVADEDESREGPLIISKVQQSSELVTVPSVAHCTETSSTGVNLQAMYSGPGYPKVLMRTLDAVKIVELSDENVTTINEEDASPPACHRRLEEVNEKDVEQCFDASGSQLVAYADNNSNGVLSVETNFDSCEASLLSPQIFGDGDNVASAQETLVASCGNETRSLNYVAASSMEGSKLEEECVENVTGSPRTEPSEGTLTKGTCSNTNTRRRKRKPTFSKSKRPKKTSKPTSQRSEVIVFSAEVESPLKDLQVEEPSTAATPIVPDAAEHIGVEEVQEALEPSQVESKDQEPRSKSAELTDQAVCGSKPIVREPVVLLERKSIVNLKNDCEPSEAPPSKRRKSSAKGGRPRKKVAKNADSSGWYSSEVDHELVDKAFAANGCSSPPPTLSNAEDDYGNASERDASPPHLEPEI